MEKTTGCEHCRAVLVTSIIMLACCYAHEDYGPPVKVRLPQVGDDAASCLDGSPYEFYVKGNGNTTAFTIGLQGGGWCYDEPSCVQRAKMALGSSKTWNATHAFGPVEFSCQGLPGSVS